VKDRQTPGLETRAYLVFCIVLLGAVGVLLWRLRLLQHEVDLRPAGAEPLAVAALLDRPLPSVDGREIQLSKLRARGLVLFIFTAADCTACLPELEALRRIAETRRDLSVVGLMAYASLDEARQTERNFGVRFPLLLDATGERVRSLHLPKTPWKVVVDLRERRIALQDPPSLTAFEQEAFVARVDRLVL